MPSVGASPLRQRLVAWAAGATVLSAAAALLVLVPRHAGTSWAQVAGLARDVRPAWVAALILVWLAGLTAHSLVLTSSLPGLSTRRALGLNLAGSAVANAVPLGGALSVGLTTSMARSWGFGATRLATFLTVSTVWNVLGRLLAGAAALTWVLRHLPTGAATVGAGVAVGICTALVLTAVTALVSGRLAARTGAALGAVAAAARSVAGAPGAGRWTVTGDRRRTATTGTTAATAAMALLRTRREVLRLVRSSWRRLSLGMLGYLLLLVVLLVLCLRAFGDSSSLGLAAAAVGVERLVTAVPVTPGGAGVGEVALIGCLTAGGVDPLVAVSAALTYRAFTFFVEIPVGLVVAGTWGLTSRRRAAAALPRCATAR